MSRCVLISGSILSLPWNDEPTDPPEVPALPLAPRPRNRANDAWRMCRRRGRNPKTARCRRHVLGPNPCRKNSRPRLLSRMKTRRFHRSVPSERHTETTARGQSRPLLLNASGLQVRYKHHRRIHKTLNKSWQSKITPRWL